MSEGVSYGCGTRMRVSTCVGRCVGIYMCACIYMCRQIGSMAMQIGSMVITNADWQHGNHKYPLLNVANRDDNKYHQSQVQVQVLMQIEMRIR